MNRLLESAYAHLSREQQDILHKEVEIRNIIKYIENVEVKHHLSGMADGLMLAYKHIKKVEESISFDLGKSLL